MTFDLKAMADGVIQAVKAYVSEIEGKLAGRIDGVEQRFADLPEPQPGPPGADGVPGKDAAPFDTALIVQAVLAEIPPSPKPVDGKDGTDGRSLLPGDVAPLVAEEVSKALAALPHPAPGRDGRDGLPGLQGEKGLDGRDGSDGKNGLDGLGFDDLQVEHDGERGFTLKFVCGDQVKAFPFTLPIVLDRGVYRDGTAYEKGDAVSWGGSLWIAQDKTAVKPDTPEGGWRLSVKRGRDGRDGERGEKGLPGQAGKDLRDFR